MELAAPALPTQHSFLERLIGAALFRAEIYDEIKRDPNATFQGAMVVLLASFAAAFWDVMDNPLWAVTIPFWFPSWVLITTFFFLNAKYLVVRRTTWGMSDWMLRTIAFSSAPYLCFLLIPDNLLGRVLGFGIIFWSFAAMVVAIRQALQINIARAIWVWFGTGLILAMVGVIASIFMIAVVMSALA